MISCDLISFFKCITVVCRFRHYCADLGRQAHKLPFMHHNTVCGWRWGSQCYAVWSVSCLIIAFFHLHDQCNMLNWTAMKTFNSVWTLSWSSLILYMCCMQSHHCKEIPLHNRLLFIMNVCLSVFHCSS